MQNIETGLQYYWPREKFYNRKFVMQELFSKYDDDDDDFDGQISDVGLYLLMRCRNIPLRYHFHYQQLSVVHCDLEERATLKLANIIHINV